ncbi:ABC transporter permease [Prescottella defluvii]|uniref:hypothetical protein n=1 Tax=Prescottella defluvii TaxID=1323361 RepID=UPI0004F3536B|nr:hypothetical protein [Prescottella defluvii]
MTVDVGFSWSQFLWVVAIFVGVPTAFGAFIVRSAWRSEQAGVEPATARPTGTGRLGLWTTGLIAFVLGFLSCAGWLSWSADSAGRVRGPALPAPTQFPTWQVVACGATVVLACLAAAHLSRWAVAGGLAAAAGTAAGFTTAFAVAASVGVTSQEGIGVAFSILGWGMGLGLLMLIRGAWLTTRRNRAAGRLRP